MKFSMTNQTPVEQIEVKLSSGKVVPLTKDRFIAFEVAQEMHFWIHKKGDDLNKYCIGLDRVCDIQFVIEEAMKKSEHKWNAAVERYNEQRTQSQT